MLIEKCGGVSVDWVETVMRSLKVELRSYKDENVRAHEIQVEVNVSNLQNLS